MSWDKRARGRHKRGYHHGNLRETMIAAALELIATKGIGGVTLAEVARMAGVSPAAPYRHFPDRANLLAAVAREGFVEFTKALEEGWQRGTGTPLETLQRVGHVYLDFARQKPALYAAMFESGVAPSSDADLSRESHNAFSILKDACTDVHATLPEDRRAPALMMAYHIWAMSHGIASLFGRGDAASHSTPVSAEELLEAGVLIYLDGLGLRN